MNSEPIQIDRKGFVKTIEIHWETLLFCIVPVGITTVPVGTVTVPVGTMTVPTETMLDQSKIHSNLIEL